MPFCHPFRRPGYELVAVSSPEIEKDPAKQPSYRPCRGRFRSSAACLLLASCLILLLQCSTYGLDVREVPAPPNIRDTNLTVSVTPAPRFRDNLRSDLKYMTAFPVSGLTNQLWFIFKAFYVSKLTDRVVILQELQNAPSHYIENGADLGAFYDLESFSVATNVSYIRWSDLKTPIVGSRASVVIRNASLPIQVDGHELAISTSENYDNTSAATPVYEQLSCWGGEAHTTFQPVMADYNVNITFWPSPRCSEYKCTDTFAGVQIMEALPQSRWTNELSRLHFENFTDLPPPPDGRILCINNLFGTYSLLYSNGVLARPSIEDIDPHDPLWTDVGQHLRFSAPANLLADRYLKAALGSASKPYIAVHIRRGDFVWGGRVDVEAEAALHKFLFAVEAMQKSLARDRFWPGRLPVLVASDSTEESFRQYVEQLDWHIIDVASLGLIEPFSEWWSTVLDSLILSRAVGFVGTSQSTYSYLTARRVESWSNGLAAFV